MIIPLLCAVIYLALSVRILADIALEVNGVRQMIHASLRAGLLSLRMDKAVKLRGGSQAIKANVQKTRQIKRFGWLIRAVMRVLRWGVIQVRICVGTGDAAATALAAGLLRTLMMTALSVIGAAGISDVVIFPDFAKPSASVDARCIFSFSLGDIMFAAVRAAVKKTQKEGFKWLSIPLRV